MKTTNLKYLLAAVCACISVWSANAQSPYTLPRCIELGLQNNYELQIVRNQEKASDNNATAANAGYLPTLDINAGYDADLYDATTRARNTGTKTSENGVLDHAANVGVGLNWTIFNGFSVRASYKRLQELKGRG